jgi:type IV pilus assembly protein PilY1
MICTGADSEINASTNKCTNESGPAKMDWTKYGGWYFDFLDPGERMNVDMDLTFGTLTIASNVPASTACTTGGSAWLNFIDFKTGLGADGATIVSARNANALIVGINVLYLNGKLKAAIISSIGGAGTFDAPGQPNKFKGQHDMWRELDPY